MTELALDNIEIFHVFPKLDKDVYSDQIQIFLLLKLVLFY